MGQSIKAVCGVLIIVAMFGCVFVWSDDRPTPTVWTLRFSFLGLAAAASAVIALLHFRKDKAPDYLCKFYGEYFNRDGFCFTFDTREVDGVCYFEAFFQNQRDQPSVGRIALRPARGFFLSRPKFDAITFEIPCEPAAFGVARLAVPVPSKSQGTSQSFEVGAAVEYPDGRGQIVRFRDGIFIRENTVFQNKLMTGLKIAGAMGGALVMSSPASTTLALPSNVADEFDSEPQPEITTWWRQGDPDLREQPTK